jgi:hypothetical protein
MNREMKKPAATFQNKAPRYNGQQGDIAHQMTVRAKATMVFEEVGLIRIPRTCRV